MADQHFEQVRAPHANRLDRSLGVIAALVLTLPASADLGQQLRKLTPTDGAALDRFGVAVDLDGPVAVLGAWLDDDLGDDSGSAYLFDANTGEQLAKLLPSDGAIGDRFGGAVAISGSTAVIGASKDDDLGQSSGSAYLFDSNSAQELRKLLPADGHEGQFFGGAVAIDGDVVVVGALRDRENGDSAGAAYVFLASTGQQVHKLLADDGETLDRFAGAVAIDQGLIVIGSTGDDDNGAGSGSAYVFSAKTGAQLLKLLPDDGAPGEFFGSAVAISGTTIVVGAFSDDCNGINSGSAYIFDASTGEQLHKLLADNGATRDQFGNAVAVEGSTVIVGAHLHDQNGTDAGLAFVYDAQTGEQLARLSPTDGAARDFFAGSVAISSGMVIAGASDDDDNGAGSGSGYLFDAARPCPADIDGDGDADADDFFAYLDLFAANDPAADITDDGTIDADDFFAYLDLFVLGC